MGGANSRPGGEKRFVETSRVSQNFRRITMNQAGLTTTIWQRFGLYASSTFIGNRLKLTLFHKDGLFSTRLGASSRYSRAPPLCCPRGVTSAQKLPHLPPGYPQRGPRVGAMATPLPPAPPRATFLETLNRPTLGLRKWAPFGF